MCQFNNFSTLDFDHFSPAQFSSRPPNWQSNVEMKKKPEYFEEDVNIRFNRTDAEKHVFMSS